MIQLDPAQTALVLIDLQAGIVGLPLHPRSGPDVLATSKALAERFPRRSCESRARQRRLGR